VARRSNPVPVIEPKRFTLAEFDPAIRKLRRRIDDVKALDPTQVAYDDARVANVESSIRDKIRDVFGQNSPEFDEHAHHEIWQGPHTVSIYGETGENQQRFADGIPRSVTVLEGLIARLEEKRSELNEAGAVAGSEGKAGSPAALASASPDPLCALRRILLRFHLCVRQLRDRHDSRSTLDVSDEYDVQDLLHALLRTLFDDIRPEEHTPSYAGKASRMDFLLKAERIVVEAKMTRAGLGAKEIGTQLIEDIARYSVHPDCGRLMCFVYDPTERISNPRGFERDLSRRHGQMDVEVIVVPRG